MRSKKMTRYRPSWETYPLFKDWIRAVPEDQTKAFCGICSTRLYAHHSSILKHASTKKHMENRIKYVHRNSSNDNGLQDCVLETFSPINVIKDENDSVLSYKEIPNDMLCVAVKTEHGSKASTKSAKNSILWPRIAHAFHMDNSNETANHATTKKLPATKNVVTMETRTISSHVLDTSLGKAASNINITLFRLEDKVWIKLAEDTTNEDGRVSQFLQAENFQSGTYKLHFDVRPYFEVNRVKSFYPFIEIVIECIRGEHYHVPLLLNPFGYSTYRGT